MEALNEYNLYGMRREQSLALGIVRERNIANPSVEHILEFSVSMGARNVINYTDKSGFRLIMRNHMT